MRSRGGILSSFPVLTFFAAIFMTLPLDIVTGQYLHGCYRSVSQDQLNVHRLLTSRMARTEEGTEHHEIQSTLRVAAAPRAPPFRGREWADWRARRRGPTDPDHRPAAMAQLDGGIDRVQTARGRAREAGPPAG